VITQQNIYIEECMKKSVKFLIVISALFYSCSTTTIASLPSEKRDAMQTAVFEGSYMNVFIPVVEVFHDEGYTIDQADEWLGIITTTWKEERVGLFAKKDIRRRMSAYLEKIDVNATRVRLECLVQVKGDSGWQGTEEDMRVREARKFYKKFFRLIKRKLEGHKWMG
jgi:hypothetical protein